MVSTTVLYTLNIICKNYNWNCNYNYSCNYNAALHNNIITNYNSDFIIVYYISFSVYIHKNGILYNQY